MMREIQLASGLKTFYSKDGLRSYLKDILDHYQNELDRYGAWLGDLIRSPQQPHANTKKEKKGNEKPASKGWSKMGPILINFTDAGAGTTEVLFDVMEEFKTKVTRTSEWLKSLDGLENLSIPDGTTYILCMSDGVPSRLVADIQQKRPQPFAFSADFQVL